MKRLALLTGAAIFALTGALVAQEPNTSAPGPTTNPRPNTANNDLANPGNPQDRGAVAQPGVTVTDQHPSDTAQGATGTQSTGTTGSGSQGNGVTGGTTATQPTGTSDTTGMAGTSVRTETTGTTTDTTSTTGTTGTSSGSSMDSNTGSATGSQHLPRTGSDMPLVGLAGLLALSSGLALRRLS